MAELQSTAFYGERLHLPLRMYGYWVLLKAEANDKSMDLE